MLISTAVLALGILPLLYFTTNRYLGSSVFSPIKTPTASTAQRSTDIFRRAWREQRRLALTPPRRPQFSPERSGEGAGGTATEGAARQRSTLWTAAAGWLRSFAALYGALRAEAQRRLRAALRANLHPIVSALLILVLLLGTTGLVAVLTVRVVQEGRSTVLAVRDVFPTAWAGMAAVTPLLADAVSDDGTNGGSSSAGSGAGTGALVGGRVRAAVPPWVRAYQQDALALVQRALPEVATFVERRLQQFVTNNNLTSAIGCVCVGGCLVTQPASQPGSWGGGWVVGMGLQGWHHLE